MRTTRTLSQALVKQRDSVYGKKTSTAIAFRNKFFSLKTKALKSNEQCRTVAVSIYNGAIEVT